MNDSPQPPSVEANHNLIGDVLDPELRQQMERLHRLTVYGRWAVVVALWVLLAPFSVWSLRSEIALWLDYFTWTAVRYSLAFNPVPAVALALCIGMTVSVLVWQSRNILFGLPEGDRRRLQDRVLKIRQQGPSHPLWARVCQTSR
ncbi:hypothetical protein ACQ4M4_07655 [Leptolyngbya sp. AN02str]|uniref:hypothetical protein n=1 Tax=Leptolyngbya sp. AN02str TaxID=3423363 RepID=UPI003D3235BF